MRRNYFYNAILTLALVCAGATAALAQSGPLRGLVVTKGADGKETPVADAQIDVYRTDLPGKFNTKTNKKGEFAFAGLPFVGTYIIAASAPNMSPDILPNIRVGENEYKITLGPGDGKRLTDVEAKALAKGGNRGAASGGNTGSGESAEAKKEREEFEKKKAEVESKNKKIEEINTLYRTAFKNGNDALNQGIEKAKASDRAGAIGLYNTAISAYNEALNADPEHPAAPTVLRNRGVAQKSLGVAQYNNYVSIKGDDAARSEALASARKSLKDAIASFNTAINFIKNNPGEDAKAQADNANTKAGCLSDRADAYVLYFTKVKGDPTELTSELDAGYAGVQEYADAELDPVKKSKAKVDMANMVFEVAGLTFNVDLFNRAMGEYQKILSEQPDNPDALMRSGLILFNIGAVSNDKAKYQEAANYLKLFIDKAPAAAPYDQYKKEAQEVLDALKAQQNVKPEKATTPTRRKP